MIYNPGTEEVEEATSENAVINIKKLIDDLQYKNINFQKIYDDYEDGHDGRFNFLVQKNNRSVSVIVRMPGCALEKVRGSIPSIAPRLYVEGSSWLWVHALDIINESIF